MKLPHGPFISLSFFYLFFIIISTILKITFKKLLKKEKSDKGKIGKEDLIFNKITIETEYGVEQKDYFLFINIFLVVATDLLEEIIYKLKSSILEYWMFEILFFEFFNSKLLKTKIYKHHIFSLIFILFFCSLIKSIVIILSFIYSANDVEIFNNRTWYIPIGIIAPLFSQVFRAFTFCNEKYYLEKRVISIVNYLLIYGIFGIVASSTCAILSSYVPCGNDTIPDLSKMVCDYNENEEIYYFESYSIYFKDLASNFLGVRLILLIIQCILYYASNYYIYVIYKKLSPIYHICTKIFNYLIIDTLVFINNLINKKLHGIDIIINIFNIWILIFYIVGAVVYLEFIELNCCDLNFYTRRKIKERADTEILISLDDFTNVNNEINLKNQEKEN